MTDYSTGSRGLYPLPADWEIGILLQRAAAQMMNRFQAAGMVDVVCLCYGWKFYGPAPLPERLQPDTDDMLSLGCSFVWIHPSWSNGDYEVLVLAGDEPELYIRRLQAEPWKKIPYEMPALARVLDGWLDEMQP